MGHCYVHFAFLFTLSVLYIIGIRHVTILIITDGAHL